MGASTGLNLTGAQEASAQASKVATAYNSSATGINLVAQNIGSGLAGQLASSLGNSNVPLGPAAFALASGIGNATASGLGLTQEKFASSNESGIEAIAGNLGLGLAMPLASRVDFGDVLNMEGGAVSSMLIQQLPNIAAAAGMGLGEGAKIGLGLDTGPQPSLSKQKRQISPTSGSVNLTKAVSSFTKGLSQSFIQGSDLTKLDLTGATNNPGLFDLQSMLHPLAAGAGAGIGMGVAIGLNLKPVDAAPIFGGNSSSTDQQTAVIAESFVQNLFSNFLGNSTAIQQAGQFLAANKPQALTSVDFAKAAEGFARGTVEGVMSAMSSVGGVKNLISGNVSADAFQNVPVLGPSKYDDSVNGSAVGFARGLSGEATILIAEVVRNLTRVPQNSSDQVSTSKRSVDEMGIGKSFLATTSTASSDMI